MTRNLTIILVSIILSSCNPAKNIDLESEVLNQISQYPFTENSKTDSLTASQQQVIQKFNLNVYIPSGFKSLSNENDQEAFVFFNPSDSSLILAKCFVMNDTVKNQIQRSEKYDSPIYGADYNDLSEFKHFKKWERVVSDTIIGPFYFGGSMYDLLNADVVMHQNFNPKLKQYSFGEFTILKDDQKYLFICTLSNGFREDMTDYPRFFAFSFNEK